MARQVKGVLFVDYVRMVRSHGGASASRWLLPEDLAFLEQPIDPTAWYPMAAFERLGLTILDTMVAGDLDRVRTWGRASVGHVVTGEEDLLVPNDPRESLMRFQIFRRGFFDFDALSLLEVNDNAADVQIDYGMSPRAEEAAASQTRGFFEGLIELAGGKVVATSFEEASWRGDPRTVLHLEWMTGPADAKG